MKISMVLIDYQEITDNQILYQMFGDDEYKIKYEKLQDEILAAVYSILKVSGKYLMLSNFPNIESTLYTTVIKVEDDARQTFDKIMNLLYGLGTIEWIKIHADRITFKIKDGYELCLYDFTEGVI